MTDNVVHLTEYRANRRPLDDALKAIGRHPKLKDIDKTAIAAPARKGMDASLGIKPSELRAISAVIEHLWDSAQSDYLADPKPDHVFLALREVNNLAFRIAEYMDDSTATA